MTRTQFKTIPASDLTKLYGVLTEGFPSHPIGDWEKRFQAWWKDNPMLSSGLAAGWVLEEQESGIVGFMGSIPVKFMINGEKGIAVAASSWYVRPAFRGVHSLSFLWAFLRQPRPDLFLSTTPTGVVENILHQVGFTSLDFPFNKTEYWLVLRPDRILSRLLLKHAVAKRSGRLLMAGVSPLSLAWRLMYLPKARKLAEFKSQSYQCSLSSSCDDSFTELWEKNRKKQITTLYRDAETLNWLLTSRVPDEGRFLIKCADAASGETKGYMVFDLDRPAGTAARFMQLKDIYMPGASEEALLSMMSYAMKVAAKKDVALIKLWSADALDERIFKKHIRFQKKCAHSYYYKFRKAAQASISPGHTFIPSLIDPDRGLI